MSEHVFVYGTLMPGQLRWRLLEPFATADRTADRIRGRLVDTGAGYPALVDLGAASWVHGWRIELQAGRVSQALTLLDQVEGTGAGLYAREQVIAASGTTCWTYRYTRPHAGMPDLGGRWR